MIKTMTKPLAAATLLGVFATAGSGQQLQTETAVQPDDGFLLAQAEPDPALIKRGKKLAARKGCAACHSPDGKSKAGPTWQGLFDRERELADGNMVLADEAYLEESILDPNAKIAKGFSKGLMPKNYATKLKDEDIQALIVYIVSLK
jgi:cytochrome c oxidase subunit II